MSTDGHVISPLFFPGGDIGSLSVHGTLNDVAMAGARPLYLTAGFILEEGFPLADLERIVMSMARAARRPACRSSPATPRWWKRARATASSSPRPGSASCRTACMFRPKGRPGQAILLSGSIGDHGVAILSKRENLEFETEIRSDRRAAWAGRGDDRGGAGHRRAARPDARRAGGDAERDRPRPMSA
jgi:hydrogenase expression/formation protein HypE